MFYSTSFKNQEWTDVQVRQREIVGTEVRVAKYIYDDKKSPFYATTTPNWLMLMTYNYRAIVNNRVALIYDDDPPYYFTNKYDSDGYLIANIQREETYEYIIPKYSVSENDF